MKTTQLLRPFTFAALLAAASLTACNSGTDTGATNVERGENKSDAPMADGNRVGSSDSTTAGLRPDSVKSPTGKQLYDHASEAKDRNNDGVED